MANHGFDEAFDEYVSHLIRTKAWQIVRRPGFNNSDREDIEQELLLDLEKRLRKYTARKGDIKPYVWFRVQQAAASIVRYRDAAMRDPRREECSLNEPVPDADGRIVPRAETMPDASVEPQREVEMKLDIEHVTKDFDDVLKRLCEEFKIGGSYCAIARRMGIKEPEVKRMLAQLRKPFEDGDLQHYLR